MKTFFALVILVCSCTADDYKTQWTVEGGVTFVIKEHTTDDVLTRGVAADDCASIDARLADDKESIKKLADKFKKFWIDRVPKKNTDIPLIMTGINTKVYYKPAGYSIGRERLLIVTGGEYCTVMDRADGYQPSTISACKLARAYLCQKD